MSNQSESEDFKNVAIGIAALVFAVCMVFVTHYIASVTGRTHGTLDNLDASTGTIKDTSKVVGDYLTFETKQLQSDEYQRMIKASFETPGIFNASGRSLNKEVIPAARDELKAMAGATGDLSELIAEIRDKSIPAATSDLVELRGALHGLNDLEGKLGLSIDDTDELVKEISKQTGLASDEVIKRLRDPRVDQVMDNLVSTTGHINGIVANGEDASAKWPEITEAINKASQATAKASKYYWAARIVSLVIGAFRLP